MWACDRSSPLSNPRRRRVGSGSEKQQEKWIFCRFLPTLSSISLTNGTGKNSERQRDGERWWSKECFQLRGCSDVSCRSHQHADVFWWNRHHLSVIWTDTDAAVYSRIVGLRSCCLRSCDGVKVNDEGIHVNKVNRERRECTSVLRSDRCRLEAEPLTVCLPY